MQEINIYDSEGNIIYDLVQWDKDVKIYITEPEIDKAYNVHFFNRNNNEAMVVQSTYENGTLCSIVPNDILTEELPINGYVVIEKNGEYKSLYCFRILVRKRAKPADYIYSDQKEYITFDKILKEVEEYAMIARSYVEGDTSSRPDESTDNAKYYYMQSKLNATNAEISENNALASANIASEKASESETSAINADTSATNAANSAIESFNYASNSANSAIESAESASVASISQESAKISELNAKTSETNAALSASSAENSATNSANSESAAHESAIEALESKNAAKTSETNASASESIAVSKASEASASASAAKISETNANTYYEKTKLLTDSITGALKPIGTVMFEDLPPLVDVSEGYMYNISNQFVTTSEFKEGAGTIVPIGSNVYKTSDGYWDILAGTPVAGVKGENESLYRIGNVNITKENIGLGNVDNTSDNEKSVLSATKLSTARKIGNASFDGTKDIILSDIGALATNGDSKDNTVSFTNSDSTTATAWTDVSVLSTGEKHSSIFNKISTMFKNIRYLYKMLGTTDISSIGDGTTTGAISTLNNNLNLIEKVEFIPSFFAYKVGHTLEIYKHLSNLEEVANIRLGITQYKSVNDYTILPLYSTSPPYITVGSLWIYKSGDVLLYKQSETTECYISGNYIFE